MALQSGIRRRSSRLRVTSSAASGAAAKADSELDYVAGIGAGDPSLAWLVGFLDGSVGFSDKANTNYLRAVRGGL
jgi:hypothetical protein